MSDVAAYVALGDSISIDDYSGGDPGQRAPRPASRELWFCNLIEPNAWGAGGVRAAFWAALHVPASGGGTDSQRLR